MERSMRKAPFKALVALLAFSEHGDPRPNWDRIVLIGSTAVTIGLIALYALGKASGRW
jgi:hypothetical protein